MPGPRVLVRACLGTPSVCVCMCFFFFVPLATAALQGKGRAPRCIWMGGGAPPPCN